MGGGSSKLAKKRIKNPVQQNWQISETGQTYNIVRHKTDSRQGQQHFYILQNRYDPKGQSQIYEHRQTTTLPIVRVFDYQWQGKGTALVPKNNFRVVTERLPHRLSSCPQLSFDQALYVLDRAFQGYSFLYDTVGPFDINSNMIGFTHQGEARVWLNENFGRNYPYHQKRTLRATRIDETHKYGSEYVQLQEIQLVRNIINVIEDRCQEGQFPEEFRDRVRQNIGFEDAREVVMDQWDHPERVRLYKIDLWKNVVRSKISKVNRHTFGQTRELTGGQHTYSQIAGQTYGKTYGQTGTNFGQTFPTIHQTESFIQPGVYSSQVHPVQYQQGHTQVNQPHQVPVNQSINILGDYRSGYIPANQSSYVPANQSSYVPVNQTSYIPTNQSSYIPVNQTPQYQTNYSPIEQPQKNAYSFSFQRAVPA